MIVRLTASFVVMLARTVTAVRGIWRGDEPKSRQRVYFANHNSHGDFVLVWTVLPPDLRTKTRPVAGADYWNTSKLKRFIGKSVFNAVLIDRNRQTRKSNPVETMVAALNAGDSLILFPEGTRNTTSKTLLPFKSGLFHLASARPDIDLVPTWIDNLNRVLPKGAFLPVPLICTVTFGDAIRLDAEESKEDFLKRAETSLLALSNQNGTIGRADE